MNNLILVESPTKARTLTKFLGSDYQIEATMGHVRDLPEKKIGIDIEHDFTPQYEVSGKHQAQVEKLQELANEAENIILATDPDREGEAIAYHVSVICSKLKIKNQKSKITRVTFHEITEKAVKEALENSREIDMNLVDAQQARRILDRLVGYKLSPLLWKKIRRGLSAGRVQSVAVRLIVERDREIEAFKAVEYWEIEALLQKQQLTNNTQPFDSFDYTQNKSAQDKQTTSFKAILVGKIPGNYSSSEARIKEGDSSQPVIYASNNKINKLTVDNKEQADEILRDLKDREWKVVLVNTKEVKKYPYPPFMTSTLQQVCGVRFGWSAKRTMQIAQILYEEGFITYHRTDSLNLAVDAVKEARDFLKEKFGEMYLPPTPRFYKTKSKVAQEAHEAIRPTKIFDFEIIKDKIFHELGREGAKLYDLIWRRFLACQANEAVYEQTSADIAVYDYLFRATGTSLKFDGWKKLFAFGKTTPKLMTMEQDANSEGENENDNLLPELAQNEILKLIELLPSQHFTQAPPKYTESSLIKALEERAIGRPSTYAPIITTIQQRRYVEKIEKKFSATNLGIGVNDFLVDNFSDIIDYMFTAKMEDNLDRIANGELKWVPVIKEFYEPFEKKLRQVDIKAKRVKIEVEASDEICDKCGSPMVIRISKFGKFLACSKFPQCKNTKSFIQKTGITCAKCGGEVIIRKTKRGKQFYGCSNYPKCDFSSWTKPVSAVTNNLPTTDKSQQITDIK